jgi:hypothetical protein
MLLFFLIFFFLVFGVFPDVRSKFTDDVSELTVGPTFIGYMNKNNQTSGLLFLIQ